MRFPIDDLVRALDCQELTCAHLEGAARLFAGWEFRTKQATELARLPGSIKRKLLEYSLESTDPDKRSRAQAAFES